MGRPRLQAGQSTVFPRLAAGGRREAWPSLPAGGGSDRNHLDPRIVIKLDRLPQHFLPDLNGSATCESHPRG